MFAAPEESTFLRPAGRRVRVVIFSSRAERITARRRKNILAAVRGRVHAIHAAGDHRRRGHVIP